LTAIVIGRMRRIRQVVALVVVLGLFGVRGAIADAPAIKLQIPFQAVGVGVTPLWTAIELGLFKAYGVDATTQFVAQSPTLVAAVLSGETPFANVGEDAVISADLNGGDIVILVSGPQKLFFEINALPGLKSAADLKGKRIGISQFGATTDFIARYVLKQVGLDPKADATILPMGPQATNLAALQGGRIDATVLAPPTTFKAEQLGFHAVANLLDYDLLFYTSALVGKRSWIKDHHGETMDVVKAYLAGSAAVFTNKTAAKSAIAKYSNTADPEILEQSYQLLTRALPKIPVPNPAAIETGLGNKTEPAAKTADPASFIDPSFVDELVKTGFVAKLYQ
jgi:ABC-type nitrate/sulfonate/bicarbonate transport system substrate-binding protein